jgi:hypothetical protein
MRLDCEEADAVNGGTFSTSRFSDVAQHGLVAQQGDAHAF